MESQLAQQTANVGDLQFALKQQASEHIVARHEAKKLLRLTQTPTLSRRWTVTYPQTLTLTLNLALG
jgi:hypothetical protein